MIEKIRELREFEDYSMREVANNIGVAKTTYSSWEYGKENIPLKHLVSLSKFYKVSISYLTGETNEKGTSKNYTLDSKKIGKRLKAIRLKNHYTQTEVANFLNIDQPTWCNYETGKYLIKTLYLLAFSKKFNVPVETILSNKE